MQRIEEQEIRPHFVRKADHGSEPVIVVVPRNEQVIELEDVHPSGRRDGAMLLPRCEEQRIQHVDRFAVASWLLFKTRQRRHDDGIVEPVGSGQTADADFVQLLSNL